MNIKNVSLIESILSIKRKDKINPVYKVGLDEVKLSSLALKKSKELSGNKVNKIINNTPDIRKDRVDALKIKVKSDEYIKSVNHFELADKILDSPFNIAFDLVKLISKK